ncbi:MAG: hypothetical protein CSA25_05445 [Desulfobacter postgatei]|uniref:Uncharacterized protein n=1 Tax=Desulfobacter postgatei TaxID=2293 RepID=A0A2G6MR02_9BACT|nr:MAG: hypothetical protein CSA25_05445 [Desulfobacter postgatei]
MSFRKKLVLKRSAIAMIALEESNTPFLIPAVDKFRTISLLHVGIQIHQCLHTGTAGNRHNPLMI